MTIALIAFFAFWFIGNIVMDEIEHRKVEREKARFQYVKRKHPKRRRRMAA